MKNPYLSLLATCYKYAGKERRKFVLVYVMLICANLIFSLNPLLFGWFVGKVQNDTSRVMQFTLMYALSYIGLKLAEWCFHGPARVMERTLAFNLSRNFLQEKYHQTLHLTSKWHQDHHSGATINRIGKSYGALRDFFDRGFHYVHTISKFAFSVVAILCFSPLFGSIAIVLGMINIWIISKFNKPFIKTLKEVNEREHQVTSNLFDSLSNIRTVITLRLENSMEKGLMRKVRLVFRPFRKNAVTNEWKWFTGEMLITVIYCVVVAGFVYQNWIPGKVFYIASLVTLLGYVNQFTSVFQNVAGQYTDILHYNTNLSAAASISEAFEKQHRPDKPVLLPANWHNLEINGLHFTYPKSGDEKFVPQSLHNVTLNIGRGKKIALIGESGSGKSTLLSVLRGLYTTDKEADIFLDGKKFSLDAVNESVTLFPQEPEIFENSIAFNITLGLPFSDEEIMKACDDAHFTDVIKKMPNGLLTEIREKGVNLSGGQKQRLALARGILAARNSHVVLLDEPTSSVDPRTEVRIYDKFFNTFSDKAIISSIHRLHLLDQFDYIYILDKGRIVDEGSYEKLMNESDIFREMWQHQQAQAVRHPFE